MSQAGGTSARYDTTDMHSQRSGPSMDGGVGTVTGTGSGSGTNSARNPGSQRLGGISARSNQLQNTMGGTSQSRSQLKSQGSSHAAQSGYYSSVGQSGYDEEASMDFSYIDEAVRSILPVTWRVPTIDGNIQSPGMSDMFRNTEHPLQPPQEFEGTIAAVSPENVLRALGVSEFEVRNILMTYISNQRLAAQVADVWSSKRDPLWSSTTKGPGVRPPQASCWRRGLNQNMNLQKSQEEVHNLKRKMNFRMLQNFSDPLIREMVEIMRVSIKRAGEWVFRKGDFGDCFYLIFIGECETYVNENHHPVDFPYSPLIPGDQFGDVDSGDDRIRDYAVRCKTDCMLGVIDRKMFQHVHGRHRMLEVAGYVDFFKATSPWLFAQERAMKWLAKTVKPRYLSRFSELKDDPDEIFIVMSGELLIKGSVEIERHAKAREAMQANLQAYGYDSEAVKEFIGDGGDTLEDELLGDDKFPMNLHNVPWGILQRGHSWGIDRQLLPKEGRVWSDGCTFPHFYFYCRTDVKILTISKQDLVHFVKLDNRMGDWLSEHARINHTSTREVVMQTLMFCLKHDFVKKYRQYLKQINETLEMYQLHRQNRLDTWAQAIENKIYGPKADRRKKVMPGAKDTRSEMQRRTDTSDEIFQTLLDQGHSHLKMSEVFKKLPDSFFGKYKPSTKSKTVNNK